MRFLTAGESHGKALVGILEGVPSGLFISVEDIYRELKRRKLGFGRGARQKIETEELEILSGVRFGKTLGSPISIQIPNKDWRNWEKIMQVESKEEKPLDSESLREVYVPRPGHADYVGGIKYQHEDMRNVLERASARETTIRVALATIARKFLRELGIEIISHVVQVGSIRSSEKWDQGLFKNYRSTTLSLAEKNDYLATYETLRNKIDESPIRCFGKTSEKEMVELIKQCQKEGDTLGGVFEVQAIGVPLGLGSYTHWDHRLEGKIAQAFMSLNAIKGVEIGEGFHTADLFGSKAHDEMSLSPGNKIRFANNRSGGITGGMTMGQDLVVRAAMKPLSTLKKPLNSVSLKDKVEAKAHFERSDVCAVPAAAVISESLLSLVLMEEILIKFGGDSMEEIKTRAEDWKNKVSI